MGYAAQLWLHFQHRLRTSKALFKPTALCRCFCSVRSYDCLCLQTIFGFFLSLSTKLLLSLRANFQTYRWSTTKPLIEPKYTPLPRPKISEANGVEIKAKNNLLWDKTKQIASHQQKNSAVQSRACQREVKRKEKPEPIWPQQDLLFERKETKAILETRIPNRPNPTDSSLPT